MDPPFVRLSNLLVREPNGRGKWWRPDLPPSGTDNFANLFRDPSLVLGAAIAHALADQGFDDLRPALLTVAAHVSSEGSRITELAARAQLTKPTVVVTVDELVRLGYVERVPDPRDGRAKLIVPTARGREAERVAREAIGEIRGAWAAELGEGELDRLEALLRRLRAMLWPAA